MKIAIIGATGNMGSALTKTLAKAGHELHIYAPNEDKLMQFAGEVKNLIPSAQIMSHKEPKTPVLHADIIIMAIPYKIQAECAAQVKEEASGKIVVNMANPINATFDGLSTPSSAAEEMAIALPSSKIVKAFNTVFAKDFEDPKFGGSIPDVFTASDDETAAETVAQVIKDAGFNPLYTGKLVMSRAIEHMTLVLMSTTNRYNYNWLAGWKILHK